MKVIDFSQNKHLVESDVMNDVAKTLWKIISEKCTSLSKFIVPKELSYCSTMDGKNKQVPKHLISEYSSATVVDIVVLVILCDS